jgi:hypothetical protein
MEVPHAFGLWPLNLSSRRPGPGELILVLYGGPRWSFWRPPLLSKPGVSFVPRSMRLLLGPPLSYPTPLKHPGRGALHSGLFDTRLLCGTPRRLLHIYEGSLGRIGDIAPSSSDVIPIHGWAHSKRFALQGIGVRASLAQFVFRRLLRQIRLR